MKALEKSPIIEVIVTHVKQGKHEAYKNWASKIQQIEKTFSGYQGVYTQPPSPNDPDSFVTILQFDTSENLRNWLTSEKREQILKESASFVEKYENHSLNTPFPGWFPSALKVQKKLSLVIKETMLVLLVLFPIVMLQFKFLSPLTAKFNLSIATFIGNAISVTLISWPMMPICLYFLNWWLSDEYLKEHPSRNLLGFGIVFALYLVEIALFAYF